MSYNKKDWHNLPDMSTPISATDLNHMEEGIADANGVIGVDAYDSTATYAINDLCIYNNTLYICTTAIITAEDFTAAHWKAISVKDMLISKTENNNVVTSMNKMIGFDCLNGVVESGSNANGTYVKFGDGTLICTKQVSYNNVAFGHGQGSVYFCSGLQLGSPAIDFISKPLFVKVNLSGGFAWDFGVKNFAYNNLGSVQLIRGDSTQQNIVMDVFSIGKWK